MKHQGLSSLLIFDIAVDPHISADQRRTMQPFTAAPLPAEAAVLVLVEFIRHPDSSSEQLAKTIARKKHIIVSAQQIKMLFEEHDLKKKMQTDAPRPFRR
jgi:hypothetical protein